MKMNPFAISASQIFSILFIKDSRLTEDSSAQLSRKSCMS